MFNIQPGTGVGFEASKQIALGLGTGFIEAVIEIVESAYSFVKAFIQKGFLRGRI